MIYNMYVVLSVCTATTTTTMPLLLPCVSKRPAHVCFFIASTYCCCLPISLSRRSQILEDSMIKALENSQSIIQTLDYMYYNMMQLTWTNCKYCYYVVSDNMSHIIHTYIICIYYIKWCGKYYNNIRITHSRMILLLLLLLLFRKQM